MVARRQAVEVAPTKPKAAGRGHYFANDRDVKFVNSGCTVLDCVLGGGWPLGRISNIVGDKSAGKTLLAIEACANFAQQYPKGHIWYREAEAAFDIDYAQELGLPISRVDFGPEGIDSAWDTIEDIAEDVERCAEHAKKTGQPGLYIIDSLDAVSSRAEVSRDAGVGTFGLEKQKELGRIFRKHVRILKSARVAMIVISQIRDRIGITFGEKHMRTGGKALDFYASQILWLHHKANVKSTMKGVERTTGVRVRAKCKKNKMGPPHRECEFLLRFGYGIDDLEASLVFLNEVGMLDAVPGFDKKAKKEDVTKYLRSSGKLEEDELQTRHREVVEATWNAWREVEGRFRPLRRKYG